MSHVESPPAGISGISLIWTFPPIFSPPQLSPDMSSTFETSNIPTDGTGKLTITTIFKCASNFNQKKN
jgi:hypothetical protein